MGRAKKSSDSDDKPRRRPAMTPEARENQLISLAVDLAEEQLRNGTASNQVIVHYLKLGSTKEKLEKEKLARETELVAARADAVKSAQKVEALYDEALKAMREYKGESGHMEDYEELWASHILTVFRREVRIFAPFRRDRLTYLWR